MNRTATYLASVLAGLLSVAGCDRKEEATQRDDDTIETTPQAVTTSTVTAVGVIPSDAGADAGATVVGVSLTTIATQGNPTVVESIARARCDRELRCGNVANGKTYPTFEQCLTTIATAWRDDLNRYECPGGFVQKELDECMREIRNEDCMRPFDSLERVIACRSSDICVATP